MSLPDNLVKNSHRIFRQESYLEMLHILEILPKSLSNTLIPNSFTYKLKILPIKSDYCVCFF